VRTGWIAGHDCTSIRDSNPAHNYRSPGCPASCTTPHKGDHARRQESTLNLTVPPRQPTYDAGSRRISSRHAHAMQISRNGIPIPATQKQPRHADLATTSRHPRGNDNTEIISAVHTRSAPIIPPTHTPPHAAERSPEPRPAPALSHDRSPPTSHNTRHTEPVESRQNARPAYAGRSRKAIVRAAAIIDPLASPRPRTRWTLAGHATQSSQARAHLRRSAEGTIMHAPIGGSAA
jgi:hypothetical protein